MMSASARTAEGGPKDEAREPRGTLGAAPLKKEKACKAGVSPPALSGAKCGQVVLYRTFLEDFEAVYLFGIQAIVVLKNY